MSGVKGKKNEINESLTKLYRNPTLRKPNSDTLDIPIEILQSIKVLIFI